MPITSENVTQILTPTVSNTAESSYRSFTRTALYVPHKSPHHTMYFQGRVPTLQTYDVKPDCLAAPVLYVQVTVFIGSVQTDKLHVHNFY
jgi:hypothetical protein